MSMLELLGGFDRRVIEPHLISFSGGPLVDEADGLGIPCEVMESAGELAAAKRNEFEAGPGALRDAPRRIAKMIPAIKELAQRIEDGGFRLVYSNSSKAHVLGGFAGRRAEVKTLWHFRDYFENRIIRNFFSALGYFQADAVICNSTFTAGQFTTHSNCSVVHNGLVQERIRAERGRGEVMEELGFAADAPLVGTAGRLERWKGIHVFIEAAAKVAAEHESARFVVVGAPIYGDDSYRDELERLARTHGIEDRIAFTGFRKDVYDFMDAMTVYAHPSIEPEPFGRGIVEAMLLEKPVVCSGHGGPLEIVRNEKSGLFFEPGNADRMAEKISVLIGDESMAAEMGAAGRARAEKEFSIDRALRVVSSIIKKTVSGGA